MLGLMSNCFKHDGACAHEMSVFDEPEGTPDIFISKLPADIKRIHYIMDGAPELYVIYMERDPRSVITSIHRIDTKKYFCDFSVWLRSYSAAKRLLSNPRFMLIRYEDLVRDPDAVQARIQERLPFLVPTRSFSSYHEVAKPSYKADEAMGGVRAVSADRVEGWKEHLPRVKAQLEKYPRMPEILVEAGYEKDRSWMECLEGVEPVLTASYFAERENLLLKVERCFRYRRKARRFLARHGQAG